MSNYDDRDLWGDAPAEKQTEQTEQKQSFQYIPYPDPTHVPNRKRGWKIIGTVTLCLVLIAVSFFGGFMTASFSESEEEIVMEWVSQVISTYGYFEPSPNDYVGIGRNGVVMYLENDPYSYLYTPADMKELEESYTGHYYNFGVTVTDLTSVYGDSIKGVMVIEVNGGSSCDRAGIETYWKFRTIDGVDVSEASMDEVSAMLLAIEDNEESVWSFYLPTFTDSPEGMMVSWGTEHTDDITVSRSAYVLQQVYGYDNTDEGFEFLPDDTYFIELLEFSGEAYLQFAEEMNKFKALGKKNLILDMRDNVGGDDVNLQNIAKYLIKDGTKKEIEILHANYGDGTKYALHTTDCLYDTMGFENICLLVNEYSASATEALTAAMRDYQTASVIIGQPTYGKGVMQTTFSHPLYNYAFRLTTGQFFSPLGYTHHETGIVPTKGFTIEYDDTNIPYSYENDNHIKAALGFLEGDGLKIN